MLLPKPIEYRGALLRRALMDESRRAQEVRLLEVLFRDLGKDDVRLKKHSRELGQRGDTRLGTVSRWTGPPPRTTDLES